MKKLCSVRLGAIDKVKRFPVIASSYESDILLIHDKYTVDGTSIMGVMSLNLSVPVGVYIIEKHEGDAENFLAQLKLEGFEVTE